MIGFVIFFFYFKEYFSSGVGTLYVYAWRFVKCSDETMQSVIEPCGHVWWQTFLSNLDHEFLPSITYFYLCCYICLSFMEYHYHTNVLSSPMAATGPFYFTLRIGDWWLFNAIPNCFIFYFLGDYLSIYLERTYSINIYFSGDIFVYRFGKVAWKIPRSCMLIRAGQSDF